MRTVIQGEKEVFTINLTETETLGDGTKVTKPFDLTGNTEIEVCFQVSPSKISKTLTGAEVSVIGVDTDGKVQTAMEVADSDAFAVGDGNIEVVVTKGVGEVTKFQILNSFQIAAKIC